MRRKPMITLLSTVAALAGCAVGRPVVSGQGGPVNVAYACRDGQTPVARFFPDGRATLRLDDQRAVDLAREPAASGERYGGDGATFWVKGREATLELGGRSTTCNRTASD